MRSITLDNLTVRQRLVATCATCSRSETLSTVRLLNRYGRELDLGVLKARLRCSRCGSRGELRIVHSGRPG